MKTLNLIIAMLISGISFGQNDMFMKKMGETLREYAQAKTPEDYISSAFKFEQIASVETENWLPLYYHAMCYTMASYAEKQEETLKKDAHLEIAQNTIEKLKKLAPEESEIYALEGLYYTAVLSVNPMERGQKYSALSVASLNKSLALNPNNPRAKQLKIANEFGTAQFFGSDTEPICIRAQQLLAEWDNYKTPSPIHPNWGKGHLTGIAGSCHKQPTNESETETQVEKPTENKNQTSLTVNISDLASDDGVVLIQLLDEEYNVLQSLSGQIKDRSSTIIFNDVKVGTYALRYFHDANTNMKMDTDDYGRPTEGYGYSNNATGVMGPPKIKKTLFNFDKNLTLSLKTRN